MVDFLNGQLGDVWLDHLFPMLDYSDVLQMRAVCHQTNQLASRHLWTPGNQGMSTWRLSYSELNSMKTLLQGSLPPPAVLQIHLPVSVLNRQLIFDNEDFKAIWGKYGKYVCSLEISSIRIPFIFQNEIDFFQSLQSLKTLSCGLLLSDPISELNILTRSEVIGLPFPTFKNLKVLTVEDFWELDALSNFLNGVDAQLEVVKHPFDFDAFLMNNATANNITFAKHLITSQPNLKFYDFAKFRYNVFGNFFDHGIPRHILDFLDLLATCFDKNVRIMNLDAKFLKFLLSDTNGNVDRTEVLDPVTDEMVWRVNYQRNQFVGSIIHSLNGLHANLFLMEMPYLQEIIIPSNDFHKFRIWKRHGYPYWPILKKLDVTVDIDLGGGTGQVQQFFRFLFGMMERPKLEDLAIRFCIPGLSTYNPLPCANDIVNSCANLKKLTIERCFGDNKFFACLWEGLGSLEFIHLSACTKLGNGGFIGYKNAGSSPVFMKLKKLKHLRLEDLGTMRKITDRLLKVVIRHLPLVSLELSSRGEISRRITLGGIKALQEGAFAHSIEKLNIAKLKLKGISQEKMDLVVSQFRVSKLKGSKTSWK